MSNQLEKIKELIDRRAAARLGGGEKAIAKQHETAHQRQLDRKAITLVRQRNHPRITLTP